jgi:transposase
MYRSDLTDAQWAKLEPLLHEPAGNRHAGGRPRKYPLRRVTDAVLYVVKTGCQWRQLPVDFPPLADGLSTVPDLAAAWNLGAGEQGITRTGPQTEREKRRTHRGDCRFAVSQDGLKRGRRGYDAGKKIKGRKRHIAVDTEGNLLAVIVHSAGIQDRVAARAVLMRLFCFFAAIRTVFVDGGYTGTLIEWARQMFGYTVQVVRRTELHMFRVLPKRWIVERTFAWLNWSRRLSKDYELLHTTSETMVWIAFAHLMLRRYA